MTVRKTSTRCSVGGRAQPLDVCFLLTPVAEYAFSQRLEHPTLRTLLIGGDRLRSSHGHKPLT